MSWKLILKIAKALMLARIKQTLVKRLMQKIKE